MALANAGVVLNMSLGACSTIDVLLHRFSDRRIINLSSRSGGVYHASADGNRIVWTDWDPAWKANQISMYDTKTSKKSRVSPSTGHHQYRARIQGDQVIWTENRDGKGDHLTPLNSDIYTKDLSTGKTIAVTTHVGTQEWPDISGEWAVWQDWRHSKGGTSSGGGNEVDIYAKNLKTGKEYRITDYMGAEAYPRVDRGRVFFTMGGLKTISLFMVDLKVRLAP
jgi:hypothetical protein